MDSDGIDNDKNIKLLKNENKDYIQKKRANKTKFSKCFNKNPLLNSFNLYSHFIYDQGDFIHYFNYLTNKNSLKINADEINILIKNIEEIEITKSINKGETFIEISKSLLDNINNLKKIQKPETDVELFIKEKIMNSKNRSEITCRRLALAYFENTGKKVSKSSVNNIIKNRLGFRYLKTTYNNNFLKSNYGNILCLCFIKVIIRSIRLGFDIIFVDESKIETINSHLKCWRKQKETIYFSNVNKQKLNIIMAVGKNKIYGLKLEKKNINSDIYLQFLKELLIEFKKEEKKKFILILDNLKLHKTKEVISFCELNKLNLVFNVPYQSTFNGIELCFRAIKRITYSNLYNSIEDMKKSIYNLIKTDNFCGTLLYNYKETLKEYYAYIVNHKYDNLNNIDFEEFN